MNDPVGAVEELIWNALDAECDRVLVELETNELGGVDRVVVRDDGTGIAADMAASYFQPIGTSWKRAASLSPVKKRMLHGKNGQGRIRAFALGTEIRWDSVADGTNGRHRIVIESDRAGMEQFDISEPESVQAPTGTVFTASGGTDLQKLTDRTTLTTLTAAFALHLEAYPDITVEFDGERLDPAELQARVAEYALPSSNSAAGAGPLLKIIEWRRPVTRALILCDARGVSLAQLKPDIQAPGFHFTAYLSWSGFEDEQGTDPAFVDWVSDERTEEVITAARDRLRAHFRSRAEERRQEVVLGWRDEGVYPYAGEPADGRERAERETFDTVATTVAKHLPTGKRARKAILGLLRSTLTHEPTATLRILEEVFSLTKQEQTDLVRLLDRTRLSSLVKASTEVTGRLDFLAALEHLAFDPEAKGRVKERGELHRILESECWIFGEEYGLYASDRSLTHVLERHLELLGRPEPRGAEVRREDGRRGIVDLMLSRSGPLRKGERHHLIVELKRPSLVLGIKELEQLNSYAAAVMSDDRFRDTRVTWDFWLVGNNMTTMLRDLAHQKNRTPGCAVDHGAWRVWVRTWGEIIEDCAERLRFYQEELEYQSSSEHAMDYLIREHAEAVSSLVEEGALPVPTPRGEHSSPAEAGA
ncbi:ATP-binding protein [Streptomyces mayteni]